MSINLNELRVGNFIGMSLKEYPNNIFTVMEVGETMKCYDNDESESGFWNIGDFEPIPLTPEILLACGFELGKDLKYHKDGDSISYSFDWCEYYNEFDNLITHVKHLHQLQNLYFALCGQELNYKP